MHNEFHYVGALSPTWGRPMNMCSHRGDIFIAMEYGQIIRVTENPVIGNLYLQEVHLSEHKPMPNPI